MEESISLSELFQVLKKRLGMIIALSLVAAVISGIFTVFVVTPEYAVSTQFLVSQRDTEQTNTIQSTDIRTNLELINTYNVIIKSSRILESVIDELNLPLSASTLSNMISVTNENQSQVVTVRVTDTDPLRAERIANTTVAVFQEEILELMNVDNVNVLNLAEAGANPQPVSPNLTLNIAIAFVLGLMVAVGISFLLEFLDTTVKSEEDIENILDIPVMGTISHITEADLNNHVAPEVNRRMKREGRVQ
ncbi:capsular polysaccharide biosynthesis protein [Halolactibacillus alkaliphilus]|uniref:Capsular polysaccharide biosynthesis protein n=1 Tax=Halolactibacillus alkaliphilus TaxID=442899 RepID=A0A511X4F7_9BACI|nr:Wzz/FepE/Etk N-terminal domain-containing protein [Halolactibacillus alkaliphilus]GEN57832.1 capsular polysaccharide biosynthesis protein [Halolactibacillus alkaliphilus]GGN75256.1 capsular polysaccharide biosynthesis protein [Halolactibacillus alkaliphilus]SFP06168.1 Capsular polysaccharide biosynthesis protein [Halolactibacillus alkaliphilus]